MYDKAREKQYTSIERMRIPIRMIDLRSLILIIAVAIPWIISSFIDHLYRTVWNYLVSAIFSFLILALLFLLSSRKISIHDKSFQMYNPIMEKTILPKNRIQKINYIDNSNYKHRNIQYIIIGIASLVIWITQIYIIYESISKYGVENGLNLFMPIFMILVFGFLIYRYHGCSRYQKAIKIDIKPGEITLYPETEEKYLFLKEKLESILR